MSITNLGNRIIDGEGNVVYFPDSLIELLYNGEIPAEILFPKEEKVTIGSLLGEDVLNSIREAVNDKNKKDKS